MSFKHLLINHHTSLCGKDKYYSLRTQPEKLCFKWNGFTQDSPIYLTQRVESQSPQIDQEQTRKVTSSTLGEEVQGSETYRGFLLLEKMSQVHLEKREKGSESESQYDFRESLQLREFPLTAMHVFPAPPVESWNFHQIHLKQGVKTSSQIEPTDVTDWPTDCFIFN